MLNFDEIVRQLDEQIVSEAAGTKPALSATADIEPTVVTAEAPSAPASPDVAPAVKETDTESAVETTTPSLFSELLAQNDEYRRTQSANWERKEKEGKSRKTIAAVADALSSLGNLVGTAYGAANQPQTYQMPFVQQDIEQDRALARATAERLRATEQSLKMAEAQMDANTAIANAKSAGTIQAQLLRNKGNLEVARLNQQGRLAGIAMQQEGAAQRTAATIEGADKRNKDAIASREREGAKNRESREKIAADRIAQMDRNAKSKTSGTRALTENAKAQKILKDAEMGVLSDLKPELEKNGVQLPYEWAKNWRQYVKLAPDFYKKNFVDKGWGDLGGKISDVSGAGDEDFDLSEYEMDDDFDLEEYEVK